MSCPSNDAASRRRTAQTEKLGGHEFISDLYMFEEKHLIMTIWTSSDLNFSTVMTGQIFCEGWILESSRSIKTHCSVQPFLVIVLLRRGSLMLL